MAPASAMVLIVLTICCTIYGIVKLHIQREQEKEKKRTDHVDRS